jgi:transposase
MDKLDVAGIEVSARTLLVALQRDGQVQPLKSFPNSSAGHRALVGYVSRKGVQVQVGLESTGIYGLDVALALHATPGIEVMVANPRAVHNFAQALMQRSKTDPLDAHMLLEYVARMPFQAWQPPSLLRRQLTALTRRMEALTRVGTMEKNRRHAGESSATTPTILRREQQRHLKFLQRQQQRLAKEGLKIIHSDPQLERWLELLLSVPGIGQLSALYLLGELVLLGNDFTVRQWVAYAGMDVREHDSGTSVHRKKRISKVGNRHLRRALYMPALVAVRHDAHFRAYYQRLLAAGKLKMVALVAAMRKLLHGIYGLIKHGSCFDGNKLFPLLSPLDKAA